MARWPWAILGLFSLFLSLGIALYSVSGLRPRLNVLTTQLDSSLGAADQGLSQVQAAWPGRIPVLPLLPETIVALRGTLTEASEALVAAGETARETQEGITGIVAPKKELRQSNRHFKRTAEQLRLLSGMLDELTRETRSLGAPIDLRNALSLARDEIQRAQGSLRQADLPVQAMLLGLGLAGLYGISGLFFLTVALTIPRAQSQRGFKRGFERPARRAGRARLLRPNRSDSASPDTNATG